MPIYPYECDRCGNEWEVLIGVTEEKAPKRCPDCGARKIRKVVAQVGFLTTLNPWQTAVFTESPAHQRYQKWFQSEETQKKIRSGEYEFAKKGDIDADQSGPDGLEGYRKKKRFEEKIGKVVDKALPETERIWRETKGDKNRINEVLTKMGKEPILQPDPHLDSPAKEITLK